jgi:DNA-binding transcriptional ArsR family regulator
MTKDSVDVFTAIANAERRHILQNLIQGKTPAMDLHSRLSPSALSQHLTVLKKARLVEETRQGRQRIYKVTPQPLMEAYQWLGQYEVLWRGLFGKLGKYLEETHGKKLR